MKKIIVGAVLLLAVAGVAVPFVNGLVMEKMIEQTFGNLNSMYAATGSDVSVEILRYDRHVFSTEIEWKIKFGSLQAIYGVDEVIFIDRADHGLTGIVSETSLEKNKWFTEFVSEKLDGQNPLSIVSEFTLSGQIQSRITVDAFTVPMEAEVVEIKAGRVTFECDKELKNFYSEAAWDGVVVAEKLQIDGIAMSSSLERISTYLWDGILSFSLEKGKGTGRSGEQIELVDFKGDYSFDVDQEENTVSVVTTFGAEHLAAGSEQVDNSFVRIGLVNIAVDGFEEFMKLYTEMANSVAKDIAALENDPGKMKSIFQKQMDQTRFQIITAFEHLLNKGLELQISDLQAQLSSGEIKGDVVLTLNKDMSFAQFIPLVQQPELALEIFSLQSDISLPAELIGNDPALVSPIYPGMPTGLFVKVGENFVNKAETRDGKLYLNGLEVTFK
jgi:uncharacterized protein YdgA (DUF945 family)